MFLASRLISNSRHLMQRSALPLKKIGESTRKCHVAAVPPRNKISSGELWVMGLVLTASMWAIPYWVFYHLPDYQKEDRHQYTGK